MQFSLLKIAENLLQKDDAKNNELELRKLCLSLIVSFGSPKINMLFEALLPRSIYPM